MVTGDSHNPPPEAHRSPPVYVHRFIMPIPSTETGQTSVQPHYSTAIFKAHLERWLMEIFVILLFKPAGKYTYVHRFIIAHPFHRIWRDFDSASYVEFLAPISLDTQRYVNQIKNRK
ncbi:hypothetical protein CEXT_182021 [Caerostris extrusa]|uniref:Uncharacterized protein n=1 Tax=Caerostris extrusa TaxID=172846 RepID=A0AAV4Y5X8_CAEEX|nr:hypothetical protein CEXT_182021 [Caerostris extrusa]